MTNMDQVQQEDGRPFTPNEHLPSKETIKNQSLNQIREFDTSISIQVPSAPKIKKRSVTNGKMTLLEVNPYLTCLLCKGYLIDATTISECLHSFCRSCIIQFLQDKSHCPECELVINKAKPNLKLDKTLQDIVYKLVPSLYVDELTRRRRFYAERPTAITSHLAPEQRGDDTERIIFNASDKFSLCLEYARDDVTPGGILLTIKQEDPDDPTSLLFLNNNNNMEDQNINEDIVVPSSILPECESVMRRYLQCPGMCRIDVLKKFVRNKYNVDTGRFHIDILYKRVPLPDHYTLIDIAYIYSWKRNEPMRFFFRITDHRYVRDRFDFYDEENPVMVPLPVSPAHYSEEDITLGKVSPAPIPVSPSTKKAAKTVRFHSEALKTPIATSTPIKPKSDKPRGGVNLVKDKGKVKSEKLVKKPKKPKTKRLQSLKLSQSEVKEPIKVTFKDIYVTKEDKHLKKDISVTSDQNLVAKMDTSEPLKPVKSVDKTVNEAKTPETSTPSLQTPLKSSSLLTSRMEDISEKERFLKSIQLLSTKEVDQQKTLNQSQRKPQVALSALSTCSGSSKNTSKPFFKGKTLNGHSNQPLKRKIVSPPAPQLLFRFNDALKQSQAKKPKLASRKRPRSPKSPKKATTLSVQSPPVSSSIVSTTTTPPTTQNESANMSEPNLKNLLNTCKIPSSLSITCVNGQERESHIKPVINHIEILKLPEVPSRETKDTPLPDSTKKLDLEHNEPLRDSKPKSASNQEKLEKVGTTMQLQSGLNPEAEKEEEKNQSELSITITVEKPKEDAPSESTATNTVTTPNGVGVHPNLPKIIQPTPPVRPVSSFQKMFEETLSKPSTLACKMRPKPKPKDDVIPDDLNCKKKKTETPEVEPVLVTNAEGKVAIPRLKKPTQTLSNLHSNLLAMNYSVSVSQSQGQNQLNGTTNKDENVVTSTTSKELPPTLVVSSGYNLGLQALHLSMPKAPKDFDSPSPILKVASPATSPSVKILADLKLVSVPAQVSPTVTSSRAATPKLKPKFTVKPAAPHLISPQDPVKPKATPPITNYQRHSSPTHKVSPTLPNQRIIKSRRPAILKQPSPKMGTTPPDIKSPKPSQPPKLDVNQLQEKYNLQNLAQLSASFNFPGAFGAPHHQGNPFAALQQAMLLNQLHQQQQNMQTNRPNWFNLNPANVVQYEKFLQSLSAKTGKGASGGHLLGKDN